MNKIRLVIADSNELVSLGIRTLFREHPLVEVSGEATDYKELKIILHHKKADIVLIDFTAPGFKIDSAVSLLKKYPDLKFIAFTADQMASTFVNAIKAGINSYIKKDCDLMEICDAVTQTAAGKQFFCGKILETIQKEHINMDEVEFGAFSCAPITLSNREREIIGLIAEGLTNNQIAKRLFLSTHTINTHRKNIMHKLGVRNTASIVIYAVKSDLINANKFLFAPTGN